MASNTHMTAERAIQFAIGAILLLSGATLVKNNFSLKRMGYGLGSILLLSKMARFNPLLAVLSLLGAKNVLAQLKQALPGYGINPILTQQALPQKVTYQTNPAIPFSSATAIR